MGLFDSIKQMLGMKDTMMQAKAVADHHAAAAQQGLGENVDMSGPQWQPIEGITLDKHAEIMGKLAKEGVMGVEAVNQFAEQHGVPPGKWNEVQQGWTARMSQNTDVRNRFGVLYNQFMT